MTAKQDTLQGWNAIADYLACDVRTAKRWEEQRGLPVRRTRRTPGEGRPNVYALVSEIDAWRAQTAAEASSPAQVDLVPPVVESAIAPPPEPRTWSRLSWTAGALLVAIACVATAAVLWARERSIKTTKVDHPSPSLTRAMAATANGKVRDLYLQGTYLLEQRTPETLGQARTDFEQAIALDAKFAPAYAGLAETYDMLREYSTLPSEKAYPLARQAAQRALTLDPNLADAHAALGYEEFFWEWNRVNAEREFRRAIELGPDSANAAHWYGAMLMHEARYKEAIEQLDRAQMLAPASASILATRAYAIGLSGHRDEAVDLLQDILTRVPDAAPLHFILAQLCLQEPRDIPRYLDQMRRFSELRHSTEDLAMLDAAGPAYRQGGETAMWKAMLAAEERLHPSADDHTYRMAALEAALGMNDQALRDLAQLEQKHDSQMIGLAIDSLLNPLHDDPRFIELQHRVGLPTANLRPNQTATLPPERETFPGRVAPERS